MKAKSKKEVCIILYLSEYEAKWLKNYVQNFYELNEDLETKEGKAMREDLFCTLREELGD